MDVLFYVGPGSVGDKIIRAWNWSSISHCQIRFSDGWCYSADLLRGTIKFKMPVVDKSKWIVVRVNAMYAAEDATRAFLEKELGKEYDWRGILLSQVFGMRSESRDKWFCSELAISALQYGQCYGQTSPVIDKRMPCGVYPAKLHHLLTNRLVPPNVFTEFLRSFIMLVVLVVIAVTIWTQLCAVLPYPPA